MFKIYYEPESPNEGACLRYDEPESPNEGACLRYVMNPNREMRGHVKVCDEPESPHAPESPMGGGGVV